LLTYNKQTYIQIQNIDIDLPI